MVDELQIIWRRGKKIWQRKNQEQQQEHVGLVVALMRVETAEVDVDRCGSTQVTCHEAHCFARQAIVVAKHHDASRSSANRVDKKVAILTDCVVFEKKTGVR